jgi:hypothetical protein
VGKSERDKGLNYERYVVRALKAAGFEDARRNLGETGNQDLGTDVWFANVAAQVKRYKKMPSTKFIKEVEDDGRYHALIAKGDREPATITFYFTDFLEWAQDIVLLYDWPDPPPF